MHFLTRLAVLGLAEELVTGLAERDALDMRREELAAAWAERLASLDTAAAVLVAPEHLGFQIDAQGRRMRLDLAEVE